MYIYYTFLVVESVGMELSVHCIAIVFCFLDVTWGYILNFGENTEEPTI